MSEITIGVQDLLSNLDTSKACSPDDIPARLHTEGAPWFLQPVTTLRPPAQGLDVSQCYSYFKNGSKHSVANYRPISLTCIVVKTLERLLHNHLTNSLGGKLSHHQNGLQKGHSCQTLLLETVHEWAQSLD